MSQNHLNHDDSTIKSLYLNGHSILCMPLTSSHLTSSLLAYLPPYWCRGRASRWRVPPDTRPAKKLCPRQSRLMIENKWAKLRNNYYKYWCCRELRSGCTSIRAPVLYFNTHCLYSEMESELFSFFLKIKTYKCESVWRWNLKGTSPDICPSGHF